MNIRDYEDEFLDDESFETVKGPRKFRVPKESGKHRDRQRNKQEIRKKKEQKEQWRKTVTKSNEWDDE